MKSPSLNIGALEIAPATASSGSRAAYRGREMRTGPPSTDRDELTLPVTDICDPRWRLGGRRRGDRFLA